MEGLQRSEVSFRRQGSSGLVWDDRLLSGELNRTGHNEQTKHEGDDRDDARVRPISTSKGGYRAGKVVDAEEPPSPRVSACGFCAAFRKQSSAAHKSRGNKMAQVRCRAR